MKWRAGVCLLMLLGIGHASAQQQPASSKEPQKASAQQDATMRAGKAIYVDECSACHTDAGVGLPGLFPPLKSNPLVKAADATAIIRLVLEGGKNAATDHAPTGAAMPAFGWKLSDKQVAAVLTYVRNSWGNEASELSSTTVGGVRQKDCTTLEARLHLQSPFDLFCKK